MPDGLSNGRKLLSPKQAKAAFHRRGKSVADFAREHGFSPSLVYQVMAGKRPGLRGQSHEIAVRLGIKDGVIEGEKDEA
jgi:gp16 family phage-associated protein